MRLSWSEIEALAARLRTVGVLTPKMIDTVLERPGDGTKIDSWDHLKHLIRQARGDRQIERVFLNLRLPSDAKPRTAKSRTTVTRKTVARPRKMKKGLAKLIEEKLTNGQAP